MKNAITIFRSQEPAPFAEAVARLSSANIPFEAYESREGSTKFPRTMYMIVVPSATEDVARKTIASIPSEIILSPTPSTPSSGDRVTAWIQILFLLFALLFGIYKAIF
jgi:hypothetical protein